MMQSGIAQLWFAGCECASQMKWKDECKRNAHESFNKYIARSFALLLAELMTHRTLVTLGHVRNKSSLTTNRK